MRDRTDARRETRVRYVGEQPGCVEMAQTFFDNWDRWCDAGGLTVTWLSGALSGLQDAMDLGEFSRFMQHLVESCEEEFVARGYGFDDAFTEAYPLLFTWRRAAA